MVVFTLGVLIIELLEGAGVVAGHVEAFDEVVVGEDVVAKVDADSHAQLCQVEYSVRGFDSMYAL